MRLAWCLLTLASLLAAEGIPREEYRQRRAELRRSLDGVLVLFGAGEPKDLHDRFYQEPNFLYLTGWREPGAILLLTREEEILFLPPRSAAIERYQGARLDPGDPKAAELTGFAQVRPDYSFEPALRKALETAPQLYTLAGDPQGEKARSLVVFQRTANAAPLITRLRLVKSPAEIALIERAVQETIAGHLASWKRIRPGAFEYEVAAALTNVYLERGCERSAYPPIVASGPNSITLHYSANRRQMQAGETVVMDAGAECSDYAADVTRTVPVAGQFTARQRELYEIVLGAQKAAIAAVRPGIAIQGPNSLHQIALDYINAHGQDLHGGKLGKYFVHGLGHYVGLDVHDPGEYTVPLRAGMVITIEPGLYIPEENIGIRVEDTLVVTENGARNLSEALPREAAEIEKLVGK